MICSISGVFLVFCGPFQSLFHKDVVAALMPPLFAFARNGTDRTGSLRIWLPTLTVTEVASYAPYAIGHGRTGAGGAGR